MTPGEFTKSATGDPGAKVAARAYEKLQQRLKAANAFDFDDLLLYTHLLLKNHADVLEAYQNRFRYLLVDEYQDTNKAQYEITKLLAAKNQNIMVVGDDDQSIYSWRGADIRNILEFESDYPNCKTVKLEENYRSTGNILNAANAWCAITSIAKTKRCALPSPMATRFTCTWHRMSATRVVGLLAKSTSVDPKASRMTRWPCSTARTLSRVRSKI